MAAEKWQPDMVIGIDFGMTCTGVAWSMGPEWAAPQQLQHWPGKLSYELRNKVDTCVAYDASTRKLASWGFLCDADDERFEYNELFKLYLDPNYRDPTGNAPSLEEARVWFRDYLSCLYKCITAHFRKSQPRFEQKRIEYVFSVPTTWKDPAMIAETERYIKDAGFGQLNKERASVYLTEAEAAAVYTSKQSLEVGDIFLVCDIGGGTTDLNVLKVKSAAVGSMELTPLSWTEGAAVGSTIIDFKVQQIVRERLERIRPPLSEDLDVLATKMMHEQFNAYKCAFGNDSFNQLDLHMPVPGLTPGTNLPDAGIADSKLVLRIGELHAVFDAQLESLFRLIDQQLHVVQSRSPKEQISYLVLSGGLGSSPYVQRRVRQRYENGAGVQFKNVKGLQTLVAGEPQLAVVHGLVMARTQACRGGTEILTSRCSPVSYGVVCRELYDPNKHHGQKPIKDEADKRLWVEDQIAWIVKRGEVFDTGKGASQMYQMKLDLGEERLPWKTRIAMSTLPAEQLPLNANDKGAKIVCEVEFSLDVQDFALKNSRWYQMKKPYYVGTFEVRLIVGTGLKFEIWNKKKVLSKAHDEIHVEWVPTGQIPQPPTKDGGRMYRVEN